VGCANSYTLLFLCPIIYLDYFWCIKYQHINIYMKMGKRNGKRKRERIFQLAGSGGNFGPPGASARTRACLRPSWPSCAGRRRGTAQWRGPARQREGGADGVDDTEEGGARLGSGRRRVPRRFSAVGPVLWRGSGGEARAGEGGHGGGANLTGGGLWRPICGTVAGARGGDAAGGVAGHNRGGKSGALRP
jgi:hypothetical protein